MSKAPSLICEECGQPEDRCECYLVDPAGDDIEMWTPDDE